MLGQFCPGAKCDILNQVLNVSNIKTSSIILSSLIFFSIIDSMIFWGALKYECENVNSKYHNEM